jgi:hypothetical protein
VRLPSRRGRWIVRACVLGSGIAGIDGTVANIALPRIGRSLHVGFGSLQWVVNSYAFTLASLILLGGSLGDRYGRGRIVVIGTAWFAAVSVLCAAAPLINPPLAIAVVAIAVLHIPETRAPGAPQRLDMRGAFPGVVGLGGLTAGLIAAAEHTLGSASVSAPLAVGLVAVALFVVAERREANPMVPSRAFRSGQFSATNLITFLLYATNGAALLFAGHRTGDRVGVLAIGGRCGAVTDHGRHAAAGSPIRWLGAPSRTAYVLAIGPLVCAAGLAMLTRLGAQSGYWTAVLPAMTVFGLGLALFVALLTATVLGAVPASRAGIASGVNNIVARAASLLAIAALPVIVRLKGDAYRSAAQFLGPFRAAMWTCAGLYAAGALLAAMLSRDRGATRPGTCAGPIALCGDPVLTAHAGRLPDEPQGA